MDAYERVRIARKTDRPTAADYIGSCFSSFFELHGDRRYRDDRAIIGGIAMLEDMPVTVIGIEKAIQLQRESSTLSAHLSLKATGRHSVS